VGGWPEIANVSSEGCVRCGCGSGWRWYRLRKRPVPDRGSHCRCPAGGGERLLQGLLSL